MSEQTRIIITRPEPDGSAFAALAAARGLTPILSPVMTIAIDRRAPNLEGVGALAFTSANGVRAFAQNSSDRRLPAYVVGAVTAEAARTAGFGHIKTANGDVASLAALIERAQPENAVLHIAGRDRAGDLGQMLAAAGLSARRAVLYKAKEIPDLSHAAKTALDDNRQRQHPLWVALFSPRSADIFLRQVKSAGCEEKLGQINTACLSKAVAERLGGARLCAVHVAAGRSAEAMADLIAGQQLNA